MDMVTKMALYSNLQSAINTVFIAVFRNRIYISVQNRKDRENCVLSYFFTFRSI